MVGEPDGSGKGSFRVIPDRTSRDVTVLPLAARPTSSSEPRGALHALHPRGSLLVLPVLGVIFRDTVKVRVCRETVLELHMKTDTVRQYLVAATDEADVEDITRIGRLLAADGSSRTMRFVAPNDERIDIPQPLYEALLQLTAALAQDEALTLMSRPLHMEVTIDEAARLLNASRQYVVERLDEGIIPSTGEGARRCISLRDVMVHKARLRALQREGLKELVRLSQEYGLYD